MTPISEAGRVRIYFLLAFLFVFAFHFNYFMSGGNRFLIGELGDSDAYVRLLQVEQLVTEGNWFDHREARMNAPYGDTLNWSRPLDVLLVAAAYPFHQWAGMDWRTALFWGGGVVLPPLLGLLLACAGVWAAAPLLPRRLWPMVFMLLPVAPIIFVYTLPGRPDHHTLLMLATLMMLGHATRAITGQRLPIRAGLHAGLWAGFGLWISTEFQINFLLLLGLSGLVWLWRGEWRWLQLVEGLCLGFFVMVLAALWIERGGDWYSVRELDKVSLSHLLGAAALALGGGFLSWADGARYTTRLVMALVTVMGGMALIGFFAPELLRGPAGDIDPRVMQEFFLKIREMRPLWPHHPSNLGPLVMLLAPVIPLPFLLRYTPVEHRPLWLVLLAYTAAFSLLTLLHARFSQFAAVSAIIPLVMLMAGLRHWSLKVLVLAGPFMLSIVLVTFLGASAPEETFSGPAPRCEIRLLAPELQKLKPGILFAPLNYGPEILYFTGHKAVAGPYHRNRDGLLDTFDFFNKPAGEAGLAILRQRGVDYVLACPDPREDADAAINQLAAGKAPAWLKPLPLPLEQDFRLYHVDLNR